MGRGEMRKLQIIFWVVFLGSWVQAAFAQEEASPVVADRATPDAGADGVATPVVFDAGADLLPDRTPGDCHPAAADAGLTDIGDVVVHPDAGVDTEALPEHVAQSTFTEAPSERGRNVPVLAMRTVATSSDKVPLLGVMLDVGVPDGLMGSLVARPWSWMRVSAGGGTNSISHGWRAGVALLPFGSGPSASLEYGRYQDGDANALAKKFVGGGFDGSRALDRVGYEFVNAHLGLDFGFRNVVFFLHGGVTMIRGQIHSLDAVTAGASATRTTEVVVREDPNFKVVGPSFKLGLLVYVW